MIEMLDKWLGEGEKIHPFVEHGVYSICCFDLGDMGSCSMRFCDTDSVTRFTVFFFFFYCGSSTSGQHYIALSRLPPGQAFQLLSLISCRKHVFITYK